MTRSIHLFTLRCGIKDVSANVLRMLVLCAITLPYIASVCMRIKTNRFSIQTYFETSHQIPFHSYFFRATDPNTVNSIARIRQRGEWVLSHVSPTFTVYRVLVNPNK